MKKMVLMAVLICMCTITGCSKKGTDIGEDKAKEIAFSYAGVDAADVTIAKSEKERDDNRTIYDIEFYSKDAVEYDCEIDAATGEVVSFDKDAESVDKAANKDAQMPDNNALTEEMARDIAIAKVEGATDADIREFKKDHEDGKDVFEGKIRYKEKEYEFKIDAQSGKIVKWETEPIYN